MLEAYSSERSGQYLNYALQNRMEWEHNKGREVSKEIIAKWKHGRQSSILMLQKIASAG